MLLIFIKDLMVIVALQSQNICSASNKISDRFQSWNNTNNIMMGPRVKLTIVLKNTYDKSTKYLFL